MASIVGKLQTPADSNGVRKDIHLITEANAVLIDDDNTLGDWIQDQHGSGVEISSDQPSKPCIWIKPVE